MHPRGLALAIAAVALAAAQAAPRPPVILISIDTLRADRLGVYGGRQGPTPAIDSFTSHGTVFDNIDSQIPLTLPSHTVLFTSRYPFESGIEENDETVPPGAVTLASVLRANGYKTAAFVGSVLMDSSRGLDQGFDFYDSPFHAAAQASANLYSAGIRRDGAWVLRGARQWLSEDHSGPVFVFIHLFDLHAPYSQAPSAGGVPNAAGYDAEIAYVDRLLGQFAEYLRQGGWWDRSLVVLLSDHGESLGDHGESSHGYFLYQSTLHVPLLVHWPEGTSGFAARCAQPAGLIDVAPTILGFLNFPQPPSFRGASLLPAARGARDDGRAVYSESMYPRDAFGWAALRSIRVGGLQYIDAPEPELYELPRDPGELHNVIGASAPAARTLRARLGDLLAAHPAKHPPVSAAASPETRRALESLGYLGHGSANSGTRADPKDRLAEYNLYEEALADMYSGRPQGAITTFRRVLARDPKNSLARYYLADAYLRARRSNDAIREWTEALKFDPTYAPAAEALGAWWMGREDYPKARAALQKAVTIAPDDSAALLELGTAEDRMGLTAEALRHVQQACRMMPASTACRRELQTLQQEKK